jgi:hypothetical protein
MPGKSKPLWLLPSWTGSAVMPLLPFILKDSGVDCVWADMPDIINLTIGIFAVLAQQERELISSRTKATILWVVKKIFA